MLAFKLILSLINFFAVNPTKEYADAGFVLLYSGAGLVVPVAGDIKLMPGTVANAAYRRIDVDVATGRVKGLF